MKIKINKNLTESKELKLTEADEVVGETEKNDVAIDATATVSEIADDIKDAVKVATDGDIVKDDAVAATAAETKKATSAIGASTAVVVSDEAPIGVKNRVTEILDECLDIAKEDALDGDSTGANVLIIGLPGSGKTASIMDWANSHGVNLVSINAKNPDLEAYLNGYTVRDLEAKNKVMQAFSRAMEPLEEPNSVLFLDEFNRQTKDHIRASLLTLINEHKVTGEEKGGQHKFKNLLFTIAAINPSLPTDPGAAELNAAEMSRFYYTLKDMDSDPVTMAEYLTKYYDKKVNELDPEDERYNIKLEKYLRIQDLGLFLVSARTFNFDTRDDLEDVANGHNNLLCQRAISKGLAGSRGNKDKFKLWLEHGANFLDKDTDMMLGILADYIVPSFEDLVKAKKLKIKSAEETPVATAAPVTDVEDDEEGFFSSEAKGKVRAKSPYDVEKSILDAIDKF